MLPYGRQYIDDDDICAVVEALKSDFLTTGPMVDAFESALCEVTGAKYAVACSNGTTALHMAAICAGLGKGDVAIVPSVTFLATANAVRFTGADVVFCDVNPDTGLMEAEHLEKTLEYCRRKNLNVKAVFPVHLKGQCVNLQAIGEVISSYDLKVIADSCHALGGGLYKKPVGSCDFEDMSAFSFHPVKTIAMGEGGAVTTNSDECANKLRLLRSHGMVKLPEQEPWFYEMSEIGFNYRISDIQCALGISQLKKLSVFIERRRHLVGVYNDRLTGVSPYITCPHALSYNNPAWHLYSLQIDFDGLGVKRSDVMNSLFEKGIGTQVHYIPVHSQPYYQFLYGDIELPGAQVYYEQTLSFPLYYGMDDDDVGYVVSCLQSILAL